LLFLRDKLKPGYIISINAWALKACPPYLAEHRHINYCAHSHHVYKTTKPRRYGAFVLKE